MSSSTEGGAASLTAQRLDPLGLAMLSIADQRMNVSISDAKVRALLIGTGEALRVYAFGSSAPAFDLAPGARRRRAHNRRVGTAEVTGEAIVWGAGFEQTLHRGARGPSS